VTEGPHHHEVNERPHHAAQHERQYEGCHHWQTMHVVQLKKRKGTDRRKGTLSEIDDSRTLVDEDQTLSG
jgi:hypothetical protein